MWIVRLALSRPYTFIVLALLILIGGGLSIVRTPTDIFPNIGIPVVSVIWQYTGMSASEISGRVTYVFERVLTTTVNDIEHIESQSYRGIAVVKIFLQPYASLDAAISEVTAVSQTVLKQLPTGITPPLIIAYNASTVPILQLGLSGDGLTEQQLNDFGQNFIRPELATVPGAAVPWPYGGKVREVMIDLDTDKMNGLGISPAEVVRAIHAQNLILPIGTVKVGSFEYDVESNASPVTIEDLNNVPIKTINGTNIYMYNIGHVRDGYQVQTNIVHLDGKRGSLLSIYKIGRASTLAIVRDVKKALPRIAATLPSELRMDLLFDQSLFVRAAVEGVIRETIIAACLTALLILLFMGDWRHTLIIAISIPLSILSALFFLGIVGETINIMTLGGLALAVGILVDDATVTIENINRHLEEGAELHEGILKGAAQIATPAFVSTLCICIVFVPMFFLTGVARFLFIPLAEAVVFAMVSSYVLSRTLVPTLAMFLLRKGGQTTNLGNRPMTVFGRFQKQFEARFEQIRGTYARWLQRALAMRGKFVGIFLACCMASLLLLLLVGSEFFPSVDAGLIRLHMRAPTGTRIEETARIAGLVEQYIRQVIPPNEIETILDNIGLPYSGLNTSYSNNGTIGTSDVEILISLKAEHHGPTGEYIKRLREQLPQKFPGVEFFFQPADIVSQILNFGLSAPIDIQFLGRDTEANHQIASKLAEKIKLIPGAVDTHIYQLFDQPKFYVDIQRWKASEQGFTAYDVASSLATALSSSFQVTPSFWLDPKTNVSYFLAAQTPQYDVDTLQGLYNLPVTAPGVSSQMLNNVASVSRIMGPAVVSHYDIQPVVDILTSVQDRDLGSVAKEIAKMVEQFKEEVPRGNRIEIRGQVQTMWSSFIGLAAGIGFSIVLVYLLIVVNFQSWVDPFIVISGLVGALAGIAWILFLTGTRLSVPALMGAIMCVGVATANSILVISFARERLAQHGNAVRAALEAGQTRLRPVIITASAMIIGMVPMSLGLAEGGEQNAPLGRAVIGGLIFATVTTLFFVPVVFSILRGGEKGLVVNGTEGEKNGSRGEEQEGGGEKF